MQKIDIERIIKEQGLNVTEVAQQLFPKQKYPRLALNRVIAGNGLLDSDQVSKLALLAGLKISDLFSGENWTAQSKQGIHYFQNGDFKAELNTRTWITKVFHKDSLFHESVMIAGNTPLNIYLRELDAIINTYKSK